MEMTKTGVQQLNTVSETLLLPLAYRAAESRRPDALIHDPKAAEIMAQLNYDFSKLERQQFQQLNVALRVREFDRAVRAFLEQHPDGVVVVQQLVPAEAAGVMFTANPFTGRRDQVMISAAWGLGESVVGGTVTPDMLTLDKATGQVTARHR